MASEAVLDDAALAGWTKALPSKPTDEHALGNESAVLAQASTSSTPKGPPDGEINLAGGFTWESSLTDAEEIQALSDNKWSPTTVDFLAVLGSNAVPVGNWGALLGEIEKWPTGSVKRVNLMTHGDARGFSLTGHNVPGDVYLDRSTQITPDGISALAGPGVSFEYSSRTFKMADVRDRLASDAVVVIYSCHSGSDKSMLVALNKLLGAKVVGFKEKIVHCPPAQKDKNKFIRMGTKIGIDKPGFRCGSDAVTKWRDLINSPDAVAVP